MYILLLLLIKFHVSLKLSRKYTIVGHQLNKNKLISFNTISLRIEIHKKKEKN